MELVYSQDAIADLARLRAFIAEHDPGAAQRIAQELLERLRLTPRFPEMGRPVDMAPVRGTLRDMIFGNYIVRYSIHRNTIIVLKVWHHFEERR